MKKQCIIATCALLLFAAGCSNEPDTLIGEQPKPTNWVVPDNYDMTASMTAIVKVDLTKTYPEQLKAIADTVQLISKDDVLAAFSDSTCLGVAQLVDSLFFLYITGPLSVSGNGLSGEAGLSSGSVAVSLRYYSAYFKNTFEAPNAFSFVNDTRLGSVSQPLTPEFVKVKKD